MTDDAPDESVFDSALAELGQARSMGPLQGLLTSLSGLRNMAGTTLGFAVFVDLLFIMFGYATTQETTGILALGGWLLVAIGGIGLLEKVLRRAI